MLKREPRSLNARDNLSLNYLERQCRYSNSCTLSDANVTEPESGSGLVWGQIWFRRAGSGYARLGRTVLCHSSPDMDFRSV